MVKKNRRTYSPNRAKKIISRWVDNRSFYPHSTGDLSLVKAFDPDTNDPYFAVCFALFNLPVSAIANLRRTSKTIKKFVDEHEDSFGLHRLIVRSVDDKLFTKVPSKFFPQKEKENNLAEFREIYKTRYIERLYIQDTVLTADYLGKLIEEHCDGERLMYKDKKMHKLCIRNCTLGDDVNDSDLFCQLIQVTQPIFLTIKHVPNFGRFVADIIGRAPDSVAFANFEDIGQLRVNYEQVRSISVYGRERKFCWYKECSRDSFVHVHEWDVTENFVWITDEESDEDDDSDADEEENDDEEEEPSDTKMSDHDFDDYMANFWRQSDLLSILGCEKVSLQIQKHELLKEQILYIEDSMEYSIECEMNDGSHHMITKEDVDNPTSSESLGWILCGSASCN